MNLLRYIIALIRAERRIVRAQMHVAAGSPGTVVTVKHKRVTVKWQRRDCE